jgi:hypothetical protein
MHPRTCAYGVAQGALGAGARGAGLRARTRRGAPARGRRGSSTARRATGSAAQQRQHAAARRHALPRPAARGAARRRRAAVRRAPSARGRRSRPRRPHGRAGRRGGGQVRAAARASLSELVSHLGLGAPQWIPRRRAALQRAGAPAAGAVDGLRWLWPAGENPASRRHRLDDTLRLLAPFDPVVWDRRRFELFWGWAYRFEAYTPAPRSACAATTRCRCCGRAGRGLGQPGGGGGRCRRRIGWHGPRATAAAAWQPALEAELSRCATFLGLDAGAFGWRRASALIKCHRLRAAAPAPPRQSPGRVRRR